jgi:hypothetical protein
MSETKYPNAGPGCDLGRYRTGEVPQVGDRISAHGANLDGSADPIRDYTNTTLVVRRACREYIGCECGPQAWYAARFDLISRAPATAEPVAEVVGAKCKACDGTGQFISPEPFCKVGLCRECNANGELFAASPAAVITGPGKYRTKRYDETGEKRHLARVVAVENGIAYGWVAIDELAYAWTVADGNCRATKAVSVTGSYVEPPPKPELVQVEYAAIRCAHHALKAAKFAMTNQRYAQPRIGMEDDYANVEKALALLEPVMAQAASAPCTPAAG